MTAKIVIFGAGISGLTAAHELAQLGYSVSVYETADEPGGFFRSYRDKQDNLPTEYSWHGMGPWYINAFDLMRHIPFNEKGSIYDLALSRPVDFGIFPASMTRASGVSRLCSGWAGVTSSNGLI